MLALIFITTIYTTTFAQTATVSAPTKDTTAHSSKAAIGITINFGGGIASDNAGYPDLSHLSYPNVTAQRYPDANYRSSGGINIGADLDIMLGKKKNFGISAGFVYMYSKGTAEYNGYHAEYEAQDGNGNSFRRLITATQASESLSFGNISIPILFKYSTNPDKKIGAFIQLGPVISFSSTAQGNMKANIDFEAVYHYDPATQKLTYSPTTAPGDLVITRQAATAELSSTQSVNDYFTQHYARGYYVGLDMPASAKAAKVSYRVGGGAMIRAGGIYRARKMINLLFGLSATFVSNPHTTNSYTPVTASNDLNNITLSNFLHGSTSLLTMQVGIHIGLQVKFMK